MRNVNIKSKLAYLPLFVFAAMLVISCDELVDEVPISEIGIDNFYRNNSDAEAGVLGIYDAMQTAYRTDYFRWGELRSDNYIRGSESALQDDIEIVQNNVTPGNARLTRWNTIYTMVSRANLAIDRIPQINGFDENLLGEALALRAYAYFTMVRNWGAVPLFTEPTLASGPDLFKSRTDANTIMQELVIPDMLRAQELIGIPGREFRWSEASLYAFHADVYMWLGDHARAKEALDNMIALNENSLVTSAQDWVDQFYNNPPDVQRFIVNVDGEQELGRGKVQEGSEFIFSLFYDLSEPIQNLGDGRGNRSGIMDLFLAGLPAFYISPKLENKWRERFPVDSLEWVTKYPDVDPVLTIPQVVEDPVTGEANTVRVPVYGDYRYYFSREGTTINFGSFEIGEARVAKWQQFNVNGNFDDTNIAIYRYSGQLLLLAEAENQLGNTDRSLELVNQVREARGLPLASMDDFGATVDDRELYILCERQFELLGEGQRAYDLIRTGRFVETMNEVYAERGVDPIDETRKLLPIFFEHFQENPQLGEQNPGYN